MAMCASFARRRFGVVAQEATRRCSHSCAVPEQVAVAAAEVQSLRGRLDDRIVGHGDAKEALVLALLAREHVLMVGPPGVAKSLLAEEMAAATGDKPFVLQLHRDTRAEDLTTRGGVVKKEILPGGRGEAVSYVAEAGGVLTADVCVLDDAGSQHNSTRLLLCSCFHRWGGSGDTARQVRAP
ncbi:unnamed protein product [Symbiodinium sp. CCMP2456]|nr:unnamed protein product [Symbiodinium sp. CCMP2456]